VCFKERLKEKNIENWIIETIEKEEIKKIVILGKEE